MSRKREIREQESRNLESRDYERDFDFSMEGLCPFHVKAPPGMRYYFIREFANGKLDKNHLTEMAAKGWKAVPGSRHPEYAAEDVFGNKDDVNDYLRYGDTVLCERPERICQQEDAARMAKHKELMGSLMATENFVQDRRIPVKNDSFTSYGGFGDA